VVSNVIIVITGIQVILTHVTVTFSSCLPIAGAIIIQATIVPPSSNTAYAILDALEFLQVGQALQHRLHAALPKQHAACMTCTHTQHRIKQSSNYVTATLPFYISCV